MRTFKGIFLALIGLALLIFIILYLNVDISVIYLVKNSFYLYVAFFFMILLPVIVAIRTRFLIYALEEPTLTIKNLIIIEYITKFIYNTVPFKLHIPAKALLLNKIGKIKLEKGLSISTYEYALDTGITILLAFFGVLLFFRELPPISPFKVFLIIFVFLFFWLLLSFPTTGFLSKRIEKIPLGFLKKHVATVLKFIKILRESWIALFYAKQSYYVFIMTFCYWIGFVFATKLLFLSTGYPVPFEWVVAATSVGIFLGGISNVPGGIGVREASMVMLFTWLGVPKDISIIVALILRLLTISWVIVGYIFSIQIGLRFKDDSL